MCAPTVETEVGSDQEQYMNQLRNSIKEQFTAVIQAFEPAHHADADLWE